MTVALLNSQVVPVPGNPAIWDTLLYVNGRSLHPKFITEAAKPISPGAFRNWVRYRAAIPVDVSGPATLRIGGEPELNIDLDTVPPCA